MRLIGVYNAEGTLRGELAYLIGKRFRQTHCSLCDVTHGTLREKALWRECRAGLPVTFETFHLNDAPPSVRQLISRHRAPLIALETDTEVTLLLDSAAIERCAGSPPALAAAITERLRERGIELAT